MLEELVATETFSMEHFDRAVKYLNEKGFTAPDTDESDSGEEDEEEEEFKNILLEELKPFLKNGSDSVKVKHVKEDLPKLEEHPESPSPPPSLSSSPRVTTPKKGKKILGSPVRKSSLNSPQKEELPTSRKGKNVLDFPIKNVDLLPTINEEEPSLVLNPSE